MLMFIHSQPPTQPPPNIKQSKERLIKGTNLYQIPLTPLGIVKKNSAMNNLIGLTEYGGMGKSFRIEIRSIFGSNTQSPHQKPNLPQTPETPEIPKKEKIAKKRRIQKIKTIAQKQTLCPHWSTSIS